MICFDKKKARKTIMIMMGLLLMVCLSGAMSMKLIATDASLTTDPNRTTSPNLKVAFIGDSGYGTNFESVLTLIKNEGAELVLHQGDFDYAHDAHGFFAKIDAILGPEFPYLASVGNHDIASWDTSCADPDGCYAQFLQDRMARIGIVPDDPDLNDQMYSVTYRGLKIVFTGQETSEGDRTYAPYIQSQLAADPHIWKICSWHKNQNAMQLGSKADEVEWGPYETCKNNGAIIATGHEHSYSRTKTLTSIENQIVDTVQHPSTDGVPGNPNQLFIGPGKSFVFVSGLGGYNMRNQDRCPPVTYPYGGEPGCNNIWAKAYTSDQTGGAQKFGALFIIFNYNGEPTKAHGYFKTSDGMIVEEFDITAAAAAVPAPGSHPSPIWLPFMSAVETAPVPHTGDAADDPAIWVHPNDPALSTVIGTDKKGGLAVYDLAGQQIQYLPDGRLNNVDIRTGFPLAGQKVALVTAGNRTDGTIAIYRIDPATRQLESVTARPITTLAKTYGSCMYRSPTTGKFYYFVTSENSQVEQWELFDNGAGKVDAVKVRSFDVDSKSEGCVADDQLGHFYITEEAAGVWKYGAEPTAGTTRTRVDTTGPDGNLVPDVEGVTIYDAGNGRGYLIVSSQGNNSFVIYQREGTNAYVATFEIVGGNGIDAVTVTDGIDVTSANLGPAFPQGVFIVQDDKNDNFNQNFKYVAWHDIAAAIGDAKPDDTVSGHCHRLARK
jgi:3-phytase